MKNDNLIKNYSNVLAKNADKIPIANALDTFSKLVDLHKEHLVTKREIHKIDATKELLLEEMRNRYSFYRDIMNEVFEERKENINKLFEIVEKGLENNNNEIVLKSLESIGDIISSSPLANIKSISDLLNSNTSIEL